jgi:hypothetical protein
LVLSQLAVLTALKEKERIVDIGVQALAFGILFDDFQNQCTRKMHQRDPPTSLYKDSSPVLFFSSTKSMLKTVLMWFDCAFVPPPLPWILAYKSGGVKVPWNECVCLCVGN